MSAAPADDLQSSSATTSSPENLVRDLAGAWEYEEGLEELLDRACSRLADEANHELRQILTLISTELELANLKTEHRTVDLDPATLERLLEALDRGTRIVAHYLDRNEVAKLIIRLDRERLDLAELLRTALARQDVEPGGEVARARLAHAPVVGDREKLETALGYLVSRSWRSREPGGRLHVSVERETDTARGFVGLDPSPASRGELAERLEASLDIGAMGIDVPYVRAVLERHGGTLYVEEREEGLGYGFEIPRNPPSEVPASP